MSAGFCRKVSLVLLVFMTGMAFAHKPVFRSEQGTDPNSAIPFLEPDISQVLYRELTEGGQIWTVFMAPDAFELYVQIGIPVLERQAKFRPSLAIVGPGLPEPNVPFAVPEGLGVYRMDTQMNEARFFHEPFTGTDSWILATQTIQLPKKGRYYIVAFDARAEAGKLWIAVGTKEKFGFFDLFRFPKIKKWVREFHEVGADRKNAKKTG